MATQALEIMASNYQVRRALMPETTTGYGPSEINRYGPIFKHGPQGGFEQPIADQKPMDNGFDLVPAGSGILRHEYDFGLQERYDFSGHHDSEPHLNYDLLNTSGNFSRKALGPSHFMNLFGDEE